MTIFPPPERGKRLRTAIGAALCVLFLPLFLFLAALFWTTPSVRYELTPTELVVKVSLGFPRERRHPLARLIETRAVRLTGGRRVMGTSLPGYCEGRFSYPDLGTVWQATTCGPSAVLMRFDGEERPVVVSPADSLAFLDTLVARKPGTFGAPVAPPAPRFVVVVLKLVPIGVLVAALTLPLGFFVAPSRLRYRLDGDRLVVELLLRERPVALAGATATRRSARGSRRVAGSAMPGYYAGRFRLDGRPLRVYASVLDDGVLVTEASGTRTFVSPEDVPAFLDALRGAGVSIDG